MNTSSCKNFRQCGNAWNIFDFDNQSAAIFCVDIIKYYSIPSVPSGVEGVKTRPEHGHWVCTYTNRCWMSTLGKNGLFGRTHTYTRHQGTSYLVYTEQDFRVTGFHGIQPPPWQLTCRIQSSRDFISGLLCGARPQVLIAVRDVRHLKPPRNYLC